MDTNVAGPLAIQQPNQGLSTTADDSNTNQVLNKIATDLNSQSGDLVTALNAVTTAINAKPSA